MRLTITLDLHTDPSVQRATELVQRWLAGELDVENWQLRPLKIQAARIDVATLPLGDTEHLVAESGGAAILRRRKALGLTQRTLAEYASVSTMTVSHLENRHVSATSPSAIAVRRALDELEAAR